MLFALLALLQDAREIREAVDKARPAESALGIYRLEWSPSLTDALASATKSPRPIFLLATEQLELIGPLVSVGVGRIRIFRIGRRRRVPRGIPAEQTPQKSHRAVSLRPNVSRRHAVKRLA